MSRFIELENQYRTLLAQFQRGQLNQEQFMQQAAQLMCQDEAGRWWTIHPESGSWHYRWQNEWRPGVPPGHTPSAVAQMRAQFAPPALSQQTIVAAPSYQSPVERTGGLPRWLLPALAGLALLVIMVIIVALVLVPRLGGEGETADLTLTPTPTLTDTPVPAATFTPQPTSTPLPEPSPEPAPSDTPEPTSTPSLTPIPQGPDAEAAKPPWPLVLNDDFSRLDSGWSRGVGEGTLIDYRDGALRIELEGVGRAAWSRYEAESFSDAWVGVTVTELASAAGVALHVTEDFNAYVFRIRNDGRYSIGRTLPGAESPLVDWTPSEHVFIDGTPNRLEVLAEGDRYRFFVNGYLVEDVEDSTYPSGSVVLWAGTGEGESARVAFDDAQFLVSNVPAQATESPTAEPTATFTPRPKATATQSAATVAAPTATRTNTPTSSSGPLSFEIIIQGTWYPGSGAYWVIDFLIQATGGDGNYTVQIGDKTFTSTDFEYPYAGCGTAFVQEIIVTSGDGQRASKDQYVAPVDCVP